MDRPNDTFKSEKKQTYAISLLFLLMVINWAIVSCSQQEQLALSDNHLFKEQIAPLLDGMGSHHFVKLFHIGILNPESSRTGFT